MESGPAKVSIEWRGHNGMGASHERGIFLGGLGVLPREIFLNYRRLYELFNAFWKLVGGGGGGQNFSPFDQEFSQFNINSMLL